MRKSSQFIALALALIIATSSHAKFYTPQDSTGLPGDHFSLKGALQMFQNAASPEAFEKSINTESNDVNNLDLNGDGEIDYVRVIDKSGDGLHAFILQVPVSENESQDIAVIEIEKTGDTSAIIQIIGDEDIYGEEIIVEPSSGEETAAFYGSFDGGLAHGPSAGFVVGEDMGVVVNVWFWPSVRFVFAPAYRPWISPWRWRHYPAWWHPWRPRPWHVWRTNRWHHHTSFAVVHMHRVTRAHAVYRPVRVTSVSVKTRNATAVSNYKVHKTRTTVTGPRGNKVTRKSTTIKGPRGKVKATKTTTRRRPR